MKPSWGAVTAAARRRDAERNASRAQQSPRITGWARPLDQGDEHAKTFHGVVAIAESVETACRGRWPACERRELLDGRDRDVDHLGHRFKKCGACDQLARIQRTEDGLAELAATEGNTR